MNTPQTANQINAPQTGEIKLSGIGMAPLPQHLKENPTVETTDEKNPGWWSLQNLIGGRAGVLNAVATDAKVPDGWKAAIKAQIDSLPADFNHIELDAHFFVHNGKCDLHLTITPSKVL